MSLAGYLTSKFKNTFLPLEKTLFYVSYVEDSRKKKRPQDQPDPELDDGTVIREEDWPHMLFVGNLLLDTVWTPHKWHPKGKFNVVIPESQFVNIGHEVFFFSKLPERQYKRALCSENCIFLNPAYYWYKLYTNYEEVPYAPSFYSWITRIKRLPNRQIFNDLTHGKAYQTLTSLFYPKFLNLTYDYGTIRDRIGTALSPFFCSMYDHEGNLSLFYQFNKVGELSFSDKARIKITNDLFEQEVLDFVKQNENTVSVL